MQTIDIELEALLAGGQTDELLAATVTSGTDQAAPSAAETEAVAQRSARGAIAHYAGELVGGYVGRILGARRIKAWSNHHSLTGIAFQIRSINGTQNTFTVNRDTEPEKIIVAAKKRDKNLQGSSRYALYGVLREDAFAHAKKSSSKGHVKSGHQQVSLSQINKVELGCIIIPDELVVAATSEQRLQLLDRINAMDADLGNPTVAAARAFLEAEPVNADPIPVEPDAPEAPPEVIA